MSNSNETELYVWIRIQYIDILRNNLDDYKKDELYEMTAIKELFDYWDETLDDDTKLVLRTTTDFKNLKKFIVMGSLLPNP